MQGPYIPVLKGERAIGGSWMPFVGDSLRCILSHLTQVFNIFPNLILQRGDQYERKKKKIARLSKGLLLDLSDQYQCFEK